LRPERYSRLPGKAKRRRRSRQRHQAWTSPSVGTSRAGPAPVFNFYWPRLVGPPSFVTRGTRHARFEGSDRDSFSGRAGVRSRGSATPGLLHYQQRVRTASCYVRSRAGRVRRQAQSSEERPGLSSHDLCRRQARPAQKHSLACSTTLRLQRDPCCLAEMLLEVPPPPNASCTARATARPTPDLFPREPSSDNAGRSCGTRPVRVGTAPEARRDIRKRRDSKEI
jgi:hypothetical protein